MRFGPGPLEGPRGGWKLSEGYGCSSNPLFCGGGIPRLGGPPGPLDGPLWKLSEGDGRSEY
jgi:hypothetical protein